MTSLISKLRRNDSTLTGLQFRWGNTSVFDEGGRAVYLEITGRISNHWERVSVKYRTEPEFNEFLVVLQGNTTVKDIELSQYFRSNSRVSRQLAMALAFRGRLEKLTMFLEPGFEEYLRLILRNVPDLATLKLEIRSSDYDFRDAASVIERHPSLRHFSLTTDGNGGEQGAPLEVEGQEQVENRRETQDILGRALLSAPNLEKVKLVNHNHVDARLPFSANLIGRILRLPTMKEFHLSKFSIDDGDCRILAHGLANSSLLTVFAMSGCEFTDVGYEAIFDSLGLVRTLASLSLIFHKPISATAAIAFYGFLRRVPCLRELYVESWSGVRRDEDRGAAGSIELHYAAYAAIRSLASNESLQEFALACTITSDAIYDGFDEQLSGHNCMFQAPTATSSLAGALVSALEENRHLKRLDLLCSDIDDESFSLITHSLETNTSLKSFAACLYNSQSSRQSALRLFRTNTSLEDQAIISVLCGLDHEDAKLDGEEIAGWIDLNKKGRRDLFSETITKERAVDLLIEAKENTHCAYGILKMKPGLFFSNTTK